MCFYIVVSCTLVKVVVIKILLEYYTKAACLRLRCNIPIYLQNEHFIRILKDCDDAIGPMHVRRQFPNVAKV